jgi:hypothetical protein
MARPKKSDRRGGSASLWVSVGESDDDVELCADLLNRVVAPSRHQSGHWS